jgi:hypothetical protein
MAINLTEDINHSGGGRIVSVAQSRGSWQTLANKAAFDAFTANSTTKQNLSNGQFFYVLNENQLYRLTVVGSGVFATYTLNSASFSDIDTGSFVTNDQTSSMSVATASYIDPTFISASAAAAGFGVGGSTDISALNAFTSSAQTSLTALNTATSSYILASQTSSMSVLSALTASYLIGGAGTIDTSSFVTNDQTSSMSVATASFISDTFISASAARSGFGTATLPSGVLSASAQIAVEISGAFTEVSGGLAGRITTLETTSGGDVTALNLFTSSIQTQVDSLIVKTSSYATTGSNIFNGNQNINGSVTSSKVLTDAVRFNISAGISVGVGELAWNNSDGTLDLGMKGGNVVQQIGQEIFYEVRNDTGIQIPNGTAVFANGVTAGSGRITVAPYTADGSVREVRFLGLATENISTGINGFVTHFGYVRGLDTRGDVVSSIAVGNETWVVGDILYVHPTVAGKLTNIKPEHAITVAIIIARHQSVGVLFVRPSSGGHLEDIHDVSINTSSLATGDVLVYNSSSDVWENSDSVNLALTASYISPTFISASAAAAGFGSGGSTIPAGTVSSSAQVVQNLIGQDVVVNSITAETYIVSSSVSFITTSFSSGSTAFGDSLSDTHTFTGSVSITGSLNIGGPFTVNNENLNISSGSIILTNSSSIVVLDSGIISGTFVGNLNYDYITNLPNLISSSAQIALLGVGILSSSAQIASQISGAFTSLSSSFANRIAALEAGSGGGSGIFALTGSFYSTTNNLQITGSLSVGSGSFKAFEVDSDGFVVLGDVDKDLNNAPVGTIAYSGSSFYLIS